MKHSLGRLENAFFLQRDQKTLEEYRAKKQQEEKRRRLSEAAGITDRHVLEELLQAGITAETVASLKVLPLVAVAWADGDVGDRERAAVLKAAEKHGFKPGDVHHQTLVNWLREKPTPELLETWATYVRGVCKVLDEPQRESLRRELIDEARIVAESMGGFLNLTSPVSREEERILAVLSRAFES